MQSLSSFIRTAAELATDGPIPASTKSQIAAVMLAEREFARHLGPVACAWQTCLHAFDELLSADATVEVYRRWLVVNPDEPRVLEAYQRAISDAVGSSEWLADCLIAHRKALRQAQQDAVRPAERPAGAAA